MDRQQLSFYCSDPADYREQEHAGHEHDLHECLPFLYKYVSHAIGPCKRPRASLSEPLSDPCGGLSRRVLPFHYHRHRSDVTPAVVLRMNVLQHRLSGQRSRISNTSVNVLDALYVSACTTDEGRTSVVFRDAVHS